MLYKIRHPFYHRCFEVPRKTTKRKKAKAAAKAVPKAKPEEKPDVTRETSKDVVVTPDLRRIWLRVRKSWDISHDAFQGALSLLGTKESELLYDFVILALFKGSYVEILREHPRLRELIRSDEDRLCMHDTYEVLSFRLGKSVALPKVIQTKMAMKGPIGRDSGGTLY